jgi:nitrite reductase/ring-hydroxylating ferredoxin subunit
VGSVADGEVRRIDVGDTPVLLTRADGQFHAVGARCPHQGAPLEDGIVLRRRIVCPWHQSVFDLTSGEILEPPALDSLRRFRVLIEGEDVIVEAPAHGEACRPPEMATLDEREDSRTFVIVGAGAAGVAAAQELRRVGYRGRILLVGQEHRLPYDRTHCSKGLLTGELSAEAMPLRSQEFYTAHSIQRLVRRAVKCEVRQRTVLLDDGTSLQADRLLLAPGCSGYVLPPLPTYDEMSWPDIPDHGDWPVQ